MVKHTVVWPEVDESPTIKPKTSSPDEPNRCWLLSAELIDLDQEVSVNRVGENNNVKVGDKFCGDRSLVDVNMNVRVQFFELAQTCLSSGFVSNITLSCIEVRSKIWSSDDV